MDSIIDHKLKVVSCTACKHSWTLRTNCAEEMVLTAERFAQTHQCHKQTRAGQPPKGDRWRELFKGITI